MPGSFPELEEWERLAARAAPYGELKLLGEIRDRKKTYPLLALRLGSSRRKDPALGFTGGFHGIERIGTRVVLAWLHSLIERLAWDESLHQLLETTGLFFIPLVNPSGMARGWRANGNGVDLMRNAPVDAEDTPPFLAGGQRKSRHLPWFRGEKGRTEEENRWVGEYIEENFFRRKFLLTMDCHSGFGTRNRVWFPYAYTSRPFEQAPLALAWKKLFDRNFPHHFYRIEPQSRSYTTHGDFWDWMFLRWLWHESGEWFLPLTLEMGSWLWVKKNPLQLLSPSGLFNPARRHRQKRVLRQHFTLFDFLLRAAASFRNWIPEDITALDREAGELWYRR